MMERHRFFCTVVVLLFCLSLILSSCNESLTYPKTAKSITYPKAFKSNGNGPPDHAPAWGYRRKHGQTVVVNSTTVAASSVAQTSKKDDGGGDDDDKTKLAVVGVAAAAGTIYAVANERDKKQTQAELDNIKQEMNVVTVNVTNSNGSISQVRLTKQGVGYVGPKGEYYNHLPTSEELQPVYGLKK